MLLPSMIGEIKGRLEKVETDSVETKVFMAKINVHMDSQVKTLDRIDKRMESGDSKFSDIEKRITVIEKVEATNKAAWVATGKGVAFVFAIAGSVGGLITWIVTNLKFK